MKTTVDIPDALLIRAKKKSAEWRKPLRELIIEGLAARLGAAAARSSSAAGRSIRWVVHPGGLPPGLDVANREDMREQLGRRP